MTLIIVHSPKGGVGATFIAAQLAIRLAEPGREVVAIDCTGQDSLKLHFGLRPAQSLESVADTGANALVVMGVALMSGSNIRQAAFDDDADALAALVPADRITVVDVASFDYRLKEQLAPHATLHLCVMMPSAAAIATLPMVDSRTATVELPNTAFVVNQIDDRLKLSRDTTRFLEELLGDKLIARIRRDEAVNQALAMFQQIPRLAPSSVVLQDLATLTGAVEQRCGLAEQDLAVAGPPR
ncbi:cellulose synthase operon protein YhjQ/BcsQ [Polymorphobacter sp.]|uniref:cellulose synthase operon protein YhjQ/BcsQ n=1 Tax=Polymorphobacter sp. TaxID=1909290 RepID=UPI003F6E8266